VFLYAFYVVAGLEVLCFLSHLPSLQNQAHITTIVSTIECALQGAVFVHVWIVCFAVGFVISMVTVPFSFLSSFIRGCQRFYEYLDWGVILLTVMLVLWNLCVRHTSLAVSEIFGYVNDWDFNFWILSIVQNVEYWLFMWSWWLC